MGTPPLEVSAQKVSGFRPARDARVRPVEKLLALEIEKLDSAAVKAPMAKYDMRALWAERPVQG